MNILSIPTEVPHKNFILHRKLKDAVKDATATTSLPKAKVWMAVSFRRDRNLIDVSEIANVDLLCKEVVPNPNDGWNTFRMDLLVVKSRC